MSRSIWKGPFTRMPSILSRRKVVNPSRYKHSSFAKTVNSSTKNTVLGDTLYKKNKDLENIQIWCRAFMITPDDLSKTYNVHNGKKWHKVKVIRQMIGHRLGEFFSTRQPTQHKVYKRKNTRVQVSK